MVGRLVILAVAVACGIALAEAGVSSAIEDEYIKKLEGKGVIPKVDIKIQKIKKDVSVSMGRDFASAQNAEQVKDATEVTPNGVRYVEEKGGRLVMYAPKGVPVTIEKVSFGRSKIEIKLQLKDHPESTIVTFLFDKKLDAGFTDRETFHRMLLDTFEGVLVGGAQ